MVIDEEDNTKRLVLLKRECVGDGAKAVVGFLPEEVRKKLEIFLQKTKPQFVIDKQVKEIKEVIELPIKH